MNKLKLLPVEVVDKHGYQLVLNPDGTLPVVVSGLVQVEQGDLNADVDEVTAYGGNLEQIIDVASPTVTYVCEAVVKSSPAAAVWRVKKIDTTNPTTIKFAGTGIFDQVANNRASLTY